MFALREELWQRKPRFSSGKFDLSSLPRSKFFILFFFSWKAAPSLFACILEKKKTIFFSFLLSRQIKLFLFFPYFPSNKRYELEQFSRVLSLTSLKVDVYCSVIFIQQIHLKRLLSAILKKKQRIHFFSRIVFNASFLILDFRHA